MSFSSKAAADTKYCLAQKLLQASAKGNLKQVSELIQQGARIAKNKHGRTPLHISSHRGYLDVVTLFLQAGCNPDIQDDNGDSSLHRAVAGEHGKIVQRLLEEGCDVDISNNLGDAALHEAARCGLTNIVKKLIKSRANVLCRNKNMDIPLHMACANGHSCSVQQLLYAASPTSCPNMQQDTPLHLAVRFGHSTCARLLLSAKCSVDAQNAFGNTPLHIAVLTEQQRLVRILLNAHAEAKKLKNKDGKSPMDIAKGLENGELMLMLISGARPSTSRGRHFSRNIHKQRSRSESAVVTPKSSSEDCNPGSSMRRFSSRVKRRKKASSRKSMKKKVNINQKSSIESYQKNLLVNPYVVPQLYSLYRDEQGSIQQSPVIDRLPNPTPEIISDLRRSIEEVKHGWEESLNKATLSFHQQIDQLRQSTEHRLQSLDKITDERIKAERTMCLHRIEQKSRYEQSVSEDKIIEKLRGWVEYKMGRVSSDHSGYQSTASSTSLNKNFATSYVENGTQGKSRIVYQKCKSKSLDSGVESTPLCKTSCSHPPPCDDIAEDKSNSQSCQITSLNYIPITHSSYQSEMLDCRVKHKIFTDQFSIRNTCHPVPGRNLPGLEANYDLNTSTIKNKRWKTSQISSCNNLDFNFTPSERILDQNCEIFDVKRTRSLNDYNKLLLINHFQDLRLGETHAV